MFVRLLVISFGLLVGCFAMPQGENSVFVDVFYKAGKCPNTTGIMSLCKLTDENCFEDDDCFGRLKCCPHGCNRECLDPEPEGDCPYQCDNTHNPMCGNDGQTYGNACILTRASCRNSFLKILHPGHCVGNLRESKGVYI